MAYSNCLPADRVATELKFYGRSAQPICALRMPRSNLFSNIWGGGDEKVIFGNGCGFCVCPRDQLKSAYGSDQDGSGIGEGELRASSTEC